MSSEDMINTPEEEGMQIYEYIVDNAESESLQMGDMVMKLRNADTTGQFLCSTARYLAAVDRERFDRWIAPLVEGAIEKDRDRRYIGSLLEALWGADYMERAEELKASDDNFRRIYKRIYSEGAL
ncbi:hypothetical protein EEL52_05785 [Muribaculaceae bacterium Isolate-113 (HZI)]|uniref:hypothetical protein n=1 Tax=Barnesiella sp. CU968 TaxID=2780099 RepID=UPI000F467730|nr:hypothetical protein [Barnesiella sp. CU968]MBJ2196377.1 hypothetical protein [Muribaculaceae bacterium]MCI9029128.1 hypothetical protein [Muribaculaceae bacterium]ROT20499.1 hypothetical protein EEL53_08515 [Muribaculaceae bacterium Isolate-114 (HZI)]ROT23245.1 hypothetical protein EEL52_05785 [Muribaculaceae bacterium Isolate-113 (HZI)]